MGSPETHEVHELLGRIPVRNIGELGWDAFAERFVAVCQSFEIDARIADDGGIVYADAPAEDDALHSALYNLLARRLHTLHD